jgi:hypothetical protein
VKKLLIFGIPVAVIITFLFQMWATGLIIDTIGPELEDTLNQLDDKMICPPELSTRDYSICIGKKGEVIVNGNINSPLSINLGDSISCSIPLGKYDNNQLCTLNGLWKSEKLYIIGIGLFNKKTVQITKLLSYTKSGSYLKILKLIKYIPK